MNKFATIVYRDRALVAIVAWLGCSLIFARAIYKEAHVDGSARFYGCRVVSEAVPCFSALPEYVPIQDATEDIESGVSGDHIVPRTLRYIPLYRQSSGFRGNSLVSRFRQFFTDARVLPKGEKLPAKPP
jgi:hypothetical protein